MENLLLQEYYFRDFFSYLIFDFYGQSFSEVLSKPLYISILIYRGFFLTILFGLIFIYSNYYYKNSAWYHEDKKFFYPISLLHNIILALLICLGITLLFLHCYYDIFWHNLVVLFISQRINPEWPAFYQWLWTNTNPYLSLFALDNYIYNLELVWTTLFLIDILLILILLPIFIYATILPFSEKLKEFLAFVGTLAKENKKIIHHFFIFFGIIIVVFVSLKTSILLLQDSNVEAASEVSKSTTVEPTILKYFYYYNLILIMGGLITTIIVNPWVLTDSVLFSYYGLQLLTNSKVFSFILTHSPNIITSNIEYIQDKSKNYYKEHEYQYLTTKIFFSIFLSFVALYNFHTIGLHLGDLLVNLNVIPPEMHFFNYDDVTLISTTPYRKYTDFFLIIGFFTIHLVSFLIAIL